MDSMPQIRANAMYNWNAVVIELSLVIAETTKNENFVLTFAC